ncbi:MAG: phospholipid carrier-dependent glycosyltransferase [Candidatus Omnitrophica bacterium]|nr:phospholipid carrier-dependent glycosyltransferase [Candidatus Omnitrophota bacterium]
MRLNNFEQSTHLKLISILIVLSYFLLMFGNGIISLTHPDEVFYIQSSKEMVEQNSWFTPLIFDGVQFEKPFLAFALFGIVLKWFGYHPSVARFWPSFFGMLGVVMVYILAYAMFQKKRLAFIASIMLSSSFIYLALSRAVLTDMIFSTWILITIMFFYLAYHKPDYKQKGVYLGFVFMAVAVLTKGLLGITFPVMTMLLYLIYKKDLKCIFSATVFKGLLLFLLLALPWHIAMYRIHGPWFLQEYFGNVHWRRIFVSEHPKIDTWYFYLGLMFAGVLPWSLFWVPALKRLGDHFKGRTGVKDQVVFLLCWIAGVYIFVQPAHSKLASYIFPLFPAIVIFLAEYIHFAIDKSEQGEPVKSFKICLYVMAVVLIGVSAGGLLVGYKFIDVVVNMSSIYVFALVLLSISVSLFLLAQQNKFQRAFFVFLGINAGLLTMLFLARPYIEPWVSCRQISDKFNEIQLHKDSVVIASKFYVRGIRYYTGRKMAVIDINGKGFFSPHHTIPFLNTDQKVIDFLKSQKVTYAIVKEGNVEDLKRIAKGLSYVLEDLGGEGGKYILKIKKL